MVRQSRPSMKILLFGCKGQVGWELRRSLAPLGEVVALDRSSPDLCGDLENPQGVAATIDLVRPGAVVNAAAYTAVDRAESESALAATINAEAPGAMAQAAERVGAWMVHYSTDYVFDGSGSRPWQEDDPVAPVSAYGRTKAEGEALVAARSGRHLVFRTSWVYALRGSNFLHTMLRLAQEKDRLSVVDDQFGAPTGAELIADVTAHALRSALRGEPGAAPGIYHLAAAGETSWHGYASHIIEAARAGAQGSRILARAVEPVPSALYRTVARRPHNSRLCTTKLQGAFALRLPPWQAGVERVLTETGWA